MSISYRLQPREPLNYKDSIKMLVENNPGQMSYAQYVHGYELIKSKQGCNLLIFGVGRDSLLWNESNKSGKTVFLEDNLEWIRLTLSQNSFLDVRQIVYTNVGYEAKRLLEEYESGKNNLGLDLDTDIRNTKWDVIIVDAPVGTYEDNPGRMKSIYESYNLTKTNLGADIFIHDSQRPVETMYADYFFKNYSLENTFPGVKETGSGAMRHYKNIKG